jgi:hypothetical protein
MQLAHIVPTAYLNTVLGAKDTLHLCVAQIAQSDPIYWTYYKDRAIRGHTVILDSDVFETRMIPPTNLMITTARDIGAKIVVLPDVWDERGGDGRGTTWLASQAGKAVKDSLPHVRTIAVAHGTTWEEYLECVDALNKLECVDIIGVCEEAWLYGLTRTEMIHEVITRTTKPLHLNGVSENCAELLDTNVRRATLTCDTSKFVVWGFNNMRCSPKHIPKRYPGRTSTGGRGGYFGYNGANSFHQVIARRNIQTWREYLA